MPRILVVDDQKDVRSMICMVLRVNHFDVVEAASVAAAMSSRPLASPRKMSTIAARRNPLRRTSVRRSPGASGSDGIAQDGSRDHEKRPGMPGRLTIQEAESRYTVSSPGRGLKACSGFQDPLELTSV
jgi:hypothetical protein